MVELLRPWIHSHRPQPEELGFSTFALDIVRQRIVSSIGDPRDAFGSRGYRRTFDFNMLSYVMNREADALLDRLDQPLADDTVVPHLGARLVSFGHELIPRDVGRRAQFCRRKSVHLRAANGWKSGGLRARGGHRGAGASFLVCPTPRANHQGSGLRERRAHEAMRFFAYSDAYAFFQRAIKRCSRMKIRIYNCHAVCYYTYLIGRLLNDNRYWNILNQAIRLATENGFGRLL